MQINAYWVRALPLAFVLLTIAVLSLLSVEDLPESSFTDKQAHLIAYASAALAGFMLLPPTLRLALFIIGWGIAIELIQWQLPSRAFELLDIVANSLGVLLGWLMTLAIQRYCPVNRRLRSFMSKFVR